MIQKRRTFATISHPDAGKTMLAEKFLLYGGAIVLTGSVKGKKNSRRAVSGWIEVEKQGGISVTSSIPQLQYEGYCVNILDTPGYRDFSEDTYRTLMAVDSTVMMTGTSKDVGAQTRRLFKICLPRDTPIFMFINKMDRKARDPFNLLEEIEQELSIKTYPMNQPAGCGEKFKGVCDRNSNQIISFHDDSGEHETEATVSSLDGPGLRDLIGPYLHEQLCDGIGLLDGAGYEFNMDAVCHGRLSPVFFDSALTSFGMEPFLKEFLRMTGSPLPRKTTDGEVDPFDPDFSAFMSRIQADMNKAHRDRIASMRICSGKFEKDMEVLHQQEGKRIKLSQPQQVMAQEREIIEEAYAGNVIGVFNPGISSIGDTLCAPGRKIPFESIPTSTPRHFARMYQIGTMKHRQFVEGMSQIAQEGAIQTSQELEGGMKGVIVGVIGVLQFDMLEHRLNHEYNVDIRLESLPYQYICQILSDAVDPKTLMTTPGTKKIQDLKGYHLLLFTSEWNIRWALEHNEGLELTDFSRG